jgi:hypothetical protein
MMLERKLGGFACLAFTFAALSLSGLLGASIREGDRPVIFIAAVGLSVCLIEFRKILKGL